MKYACLVYNDESKLREISEDELSSVVSECMAWVGELEASGKHVFSSGLQSTGAATTVRNNGGHVSITDGPFAETKEILGGLTVIEARDLNEALQIASKFPTAKLGCVEVRPVLDPMAEQSNPLDQKLAACVRHAISVAKCEI